MVCFALINSVILNLYVFCSCFKTLADVLHWDFFLRKWKFESREMSMKRKKKKEKKKKKEEEEEAEEAEEEEEDRQADKPLNIN